jgi:hypothetical protein
MSEAVGEPEAGTAPLRVIKHDLFAQEYAVWPQGETAARRAG